MWKGQVKETFFDVMPNLGTSVVVLFVKREVRWLLNQDRPCRVPGWTISRWEYNLQLVVGESDKTLWSWPSQATGCLAEIVHFHPGQCSNKQDLLFFYFAELLTCLWDSPRLSQKVWLCSHLSISLPLLASYSLFQALDLQREAVFLSRQGLSQPFLLLDPNSILSFLQTEGLQGELHSHLQGFLVQSYTM